MTEPLVTIFTPVYNHENYLDEYFESIIKQTYENIELIIIDDASTDQSVKVIEKWLPMIEDRFVKFSYIPRNENKGLIYNCNEGVDLARGKYMYLFASDDIMLPTNVEEKVNYLEKNPQYSLVYSDGYIQYENSEITFSSIYKLLFRRKFSNTTKHYFGNVKNEVFIKNFIRAATVCIRRECIINVGKYSTKYSLEDNYMWIKLSQIYEFGFINKPLVKYRVHNKSLSHSEKNLEKLNSSLFRMIEDFSKEGNYEQFVIEKAYKNYYGIRALQSYKNSNYESFNYFYEKSEKVVGLKLRKILITLKRKL